MQAARGAAIAATTGSSPPRRTVLLFVTAALVLVADIVSKVAIVATLRPQQRVHLIDGILQLTETRNGGAAFSVGTGATVLFTVVAAAVVLVIVRQARRLVTRSWALTLGLLLGGALGNLVDRLFRAPGPLRGRVVDWIQLPHWPVFNLADSAIVIGGCLAVILASRGIPLDGQLADDEPAADGVDGGDREGAAGRGGSEQPDVADPTGDGARR